MIIYKSPYLLGIKKIFSILIVIFVLIAGCGKGYDKSFFGKPTYNEKEFKIHDKKSFEVINKEFAKDNVRAYFRGREIEGSDGATFQLLKKGYAVDKNAVYFATSYRDGTTYYTKKVSVINRLDGEDPNQFVVLEDNFAKGNKFAYWGHGKALPESHGSSFEVLGGGYARDQNKAYFKFHAIYNSISKSFRLLDYPYAVDEKSVFYQNLQIDNANPLTFTVLTGVVGKDDKMVYDKWKVVPGIHAPSFKCFKNTLYALDKDYAYYQTEVIPNADLASFWAKEGSSYAKDKNNYFYKTEIIKPTHEFHPFAVGDYENTKHE